MFGLFKKKKKSSPSIVDIDGQPLVAGDHVMSLRYELGKCVILQAEQGLVYESISSGQQVSWVKMIDASTERQKVQKVSVD